ncbi:MAG: amidohydrolase [Clostridiales bacterium]|nr:amidohydrolase [Clostridiales bacterium]
MDLYKRALALQQEITSHRRYLHTHAEAGLSLPIAKEYAKKQLEAIGIEAADCGMGVAATVGQGGKVFLLRADMDALPMKEESGESFASQTSCAHTCGHDLHAAMLLGAARLLKEKEGALGGTVKFMFQPAEETLCGAKHMIENGILSDPPVDAALAFHVNAGHGSVGEFLYNSSGALMFSADMFRITVRGKGTHGAYPQYGVDPILIGSQIVIALEALIARETDPQAAAALTIGSFQAGTNTNIIPETAVLLGSVRTNAPALREMLVRRIREAAAGTAAVYGGKAELEILSGAPPLICAPALTEDIVRYLQETGVPDAAPVPGYSVSGSEDFAYIAERVPSAFLFLSAGFPDERGDFTAHNPKVRFNEDVLPLGAAWLAHAAIRWLEEH